jgi:kinase suppressor of Ras 2
MSLYLTSILCKMLLIKFNRKGDWLTIPKGWLCYLAPEMIRCLRINSQQENEELPFSTATDVYAFG